jgi:DNA-binding GntR family transcriptional regulator
MATTGTLARSVLADQVKDRLLEEILAGRYAFDSRFVEPRVVRVLRPC